MSSILITGANRGIGLEFVRQLASSKEGKWKYVFAACRNPEKAEELKQMAASYSSVKLVELDVTSDATIETAVNQVSSVVGDKGLNVVINNAGIFGSQESNSLDKLSRKGLLEVFDVNAAGALMVTQKFLPLLKQGAAASKVSGFSFYRGGIYNITTGVASIADNTSGRMYALRLSKVALNMITKSLSVDLKADNILAIGLVPGSVQTDMGGSNAKLTVKDCVSMLLKVMENAGEKESGEAVNYKGEIFPY
ncbi:hypothetical protein HOLleu_10899 [Holothuria leucospilota]|uniref:Uncharacterized protein n=1 Tax=Holothuria leucospilota TaxID=206669 RepID=A0A9Q1HET6_HOLLE|nr:hypothetical protein HOLleu_10899 [Holothuria leucospilota]